MHVLREMMQSLRASPVFALAVLITLGLAGLNGVMVALMALRLNFLLSRPFSQMAHFTEPHHRIHDLTFGFLFVATVVGMLAQLRRPSQNVAGLVMALIPWVGLLLAAVLSDAFVRVVLVNPSRSVIPVTLIAALLHPAGRDFFRSFRVSRVNWLMLALVIIAAMPLFAYASTNIGLQRTIPDDHAGMGHYGFMAAFSFTVIGVGLLASLRPDSWRLTAWVAGLLPALLGAASVLYPDASSSLGLVWALAAIAWGAVFVATAELTKNVEHPTLLASLRDSGGVRSNDDPRVGVDRESTAHTPRWKNVVGGIALVLVLLFVALQFSGIGIGGGPGQGSGQSATPGAEDHRPPPGIPDH